MRSFPGSALKSNKELQIDGITPDNPIPPEGRGRGGLASSVKNTEAWPCLSLDPQSMFSHWDLSAPRYDLSWQVFLLVLVYIEKALIASLSAQTMISTEIGTRVQHDAEHRRDW